WTGRVIGVFPVGEMLVSNNTTTTQKLSDFSVSSLCRTSPEPNSTSTPASADAVVTNWRLDGLPVPATLPVLPTVPQPQG
ncbi:unnamed protein product, partial [Nesidiocoris tenuis]